MQERLTLTVTTPTRDLDSSYILSLMRNCDYQVIPSQPACLIYDTEAILLNLLANKQFKDVLLDIALPYHHQQPGQLTDIYFGRYIIFNQALIAVRLASAPAASAYSHGIKKWIAGQRAYHDVPLCIRKFYRQEQVKGNEKVLVGDFSIKFRGVQMALLFES